MALRSVLILTYHFPPSAASGAFRMLGFARHLPSHGWRAVVVAPPTLPWEPVDHELCKRLPPETTVYPVPYTKNKVVRKLAQLSGWLPRAAWTCARAVHEQRPEAILTSGPPHQIHWLGYWLTKRYGLPWLADFRDPWNPDCRAERGHGLASRQIAAQEALMMRAASAVIANAPGASRTIRDAYPPFRSKVVTLPNGYDRETFDGLTGSTPARAPGSPSRLVHAGAIYHGRDPRPVLDALKALSIDTPDVDRLHLEANFLGPPPESGLDLVGEAHARGIDGLVTVAGQVPYARALQEMVAADILLLMDSPGRTVGVPAKLYEYIGAGRPVLALGERGGDLEWVLARSGIPYRIAPPGNAAAITEALAGLARETATSAPARGTDQFSREAIAGRLAALLAHSVDQRAGQVNLDLADIDPDIEDAQTTGAPVAVGGASL